jgi:hypothetical protein
MNVDGDDLQVLAVVLRWATPRWERENGHRWWELRDLARRVDQAARADRFAPSVVASVTYLPPARTVECVDCGVETDRPRKGRCNKCRMRRARAS